MTITPANFEILNETLINNPQGNSLFDVPITDKIFNEDLLTRINNTLPSFDSINDYIIERI